MTDKRKPVARLSFREVAYDEDVSYFLRVRLRAECTDNQAGEVVKIGIQGPNGKWKYPPRTLLGRDISDRYSWYDVLEWTPTVDDVLVVVPGSFEDTPAAKSLFIDQFEFGRK